MGDSFPIIPDPRKRRMFDPRTMPILSGDVPTDETGPTIPLRMNAQPVASLADQFGRNVNASVSQVGTEPPISQEPPVEQAPDARSRMGAYQEFAQKGPAETRLEALQQAGPEKHTGGIGSRFKDMGMAFLEGGRPLATFFDPQRRHDRMYQEKVAEAAGMAGVENTGRRERMSELDKQAEATGIIPGTVDQPTEQRRNRMEMEKQRQAANDLSRDKFKTLQQRRREQMENDATKNRIAVFNKNPSAFSAEARQRLAEDLDMPELLEPTDYKQFDVKIDSAGNYTRINKGTGRAATVTDDTSGKAVGSFDAAKLRAQQEHLRKMEQIGLINSQTGQINASTNAASLQQRWEALDRNTIKSATQAEDKAAGYEEQATMMEQSKMPDGKPWPREAIEATRARAKNLGEQAQAMRNRQRGQSDPRIGKTFKTKDGQRVKVTGISADGRPITVPVQ